MIKAGEFHVDPSLQQSPNSVYVENELDFFSQNIFLQFYCCNLGRNNVCTATHILFLVTLSRGCCNTTSRPDYCMFVWSFIFKPKMSLKSSRSQNCKSIFKKTKTKALTDVCCNKLHDAQRALILFQHNIEHQSITVIPQVSHSNVAILCPPSAINMLISPEIWRENISMKSGFLSLITAAS